MVYHFTKVIGFDIEADSLEDAMELAEAEDRDLDASIEYFNDPDDDEYDEIHIDVHTGNFEYAGYTDCSSAKDEATAEKLLRDYLISEDEEDYEDDEDEEDSAEDITPEAMARLFEAFLASLIGTRE